MTKELKCAKGERSVGFVQMFFDAQLQAQTLSLDMADDASLTPNNGVKLVEVEFPKPAYATHKLER